MKILYLVRHAKSSWDYDDLCDFDRPLGTKGIKQLQTIIPALKKEKVRPDVLVSSPAVRAIQTAMMVLHGLELPTEAFTLRAPLYEGAALEYLDAIQSLSDSFDTAMIVGHHPGITNAVNRLLGEHFEKIPTSAVYGIRWKTDSWTKCVSEKGTSVFALTR